MSIHPRLRRLFHGGSGRCIDVAVDHGLFGEPAFLPGIEDMPAVLERLVAAAPDAIQLSLGQAPLLADRTGERPALVVRSDVANVYGSEPAAHPFSLVVDGVVAAAVALDAACVCVNLFDIPGADDLRRQCIENIARLRSECDRAGMGLMVEPLAFKPGRGAPEPEGDPERIAALVRQATELGADVIKADPSDGLRHYRRIVTVARVPLLVRGGGRVDDAEILRRTAAVLELGAAGIVYGRNVIQHERPEAMVRALRAIVHEDASVEAALAELGS
jgi:fructose-bisphosphate aldolase, class I